MTLKPSTLARAIQPTLIRTVTAKARPTTLHLGLGQPDVPLASWAVEALATTTTAPYTLNRGLPELVDAVSARNSGDGVIITTGTEEALALAVFGLIEPGQDVLVPDPGFPAYPNLVRAAGGRPVPYALGERFELDADLVRTAWTPQTAAIILNSPGNPTGAVASAEATAEVARLCEEQGAFWISDEIYADFVWEGEHASPRHTSTAGVVVNGLSKSHSAMGLRIGWIAGPHEAIDALVPLHQHLVTCAAAPSQRAAVAMLDHHDEQVQNIREIFEVRRATVQRILAEYGVVDLNLDGAFYAFVDVRERLKEGESSLDLALALLAEEDVLTIPGIGFGPGGEGYLRLAYTVADPTLSEALHRVGRFLASR